MKKYKIFGTVCIVFCLLFAFGVHAAEILLESESSQLTVGDVISVSVLLDTQLQQMNAAEATIVFPEDTLEFVDVRDSESVLNFWVSKPAYKGTGMVHFSGITPGGFSADNSILLEVLFKVIKEGEGEVYLRDATALLHDGLGTDASVTLRPFAFTSVKGADVPFDASLREDTEMPEAFPVEIANDADVFEGRHFLVFATEDKGSGMHHFEVKEGLWGSYETALSPYELKDQSLTKKIFIKAVDREGNERITVFYPQNWKSWHQNNLLILSILTVCILTLLLGWKRTRQFFRK